MNTKNSENILVITLFIFLFAATSKEVQSMLEGFFETFSIILVIAFFYLIIVSIYEKKLKGN